MDMPRCDVRIERNTSGLTPQRVFVNGNEIPMVADVSHYVSPGERPRMTLEIYPSSVLDGELPPEPKKVETVKPGRRKKITRGSQ
jgi:hypothetical protein